MGCSPRPRVFVLGTGRAGVVASGFSWRLLGRLRTRVAPFLLRGAELPPTCLRRPPLAPDRALPTARPSFQVPSPPRPLRGLLVVEMFSIAYASRPRLRSRLTQGGRTLPWKPWPYGGVDSRHSSLLTPAYSLRRAPGALPVPLRRAADAPLPLRGRILGIRGFGGALESR